MSNDGSVDAELPPLSVFGFAHPLGSAITGRLIGAGYPVYGFDHDPNAMQRFANAGGHACRSVAEAAGSGHLVLTCLGNPEAVEQLMVGPDQALASIDRGAIWVELTTNRSDTIRRLADQAPTGVSVVDAPITGTPAKAAKGELDLFLGGDTTSVDAAVPVLSHLGSTSRCGPLGTGNVVRLVTAQLRAIQVAALGEAFALGVSNGVLLETLWNAIKQSGADSAVARNDAPAIFAGNHRSDDPLARTLADVHLTEELTARLSVGLPLTNTAHQMYRAAAETYGTDEGELAVTRLLEDATGLSYRIAHWEA